MDDTSGFAPAIRSILATARERGESREPIQVDARSLPQAFADAEDDRRVPIIAEVKPTSPTTDGERDKDPVALAESMVEGGAAAISVLTEPEHFGGTPADLTAVREAVDVPVLRKDFILDEAQLDTVAADVILLIARFVDDLDGLLSAARECGFQVLVEVHTEDELATAVDAGAAIIGINNRDLAELDVDLGTFESLAPAAPPDVTLIAESGISDTADVTRMRRAGADGLLVGSAIMAGDVAERTQTLSTATTEAEQ
jgi:indole-3-glycerol phosphate synthase